MDYLEFDNLFDCIAVINNRSEIVYANQSFVRFCELSHNRILRVKKLTQVLHFEGMPFDLATLNRITAASQYAECMVALPAKGHRRVQFFLQPCGDQQWMMVFRDTTLEDRLSSKYRSELETKEAMIKTLDQNLRENRILLRLAERLNASEQGPNSLHVCLTEIENSMGFHGSAVCISAEGKALECLSKNSNGPGPSVSSRIVGANDCKRWLSEAVEPKSVSDRLSLQLLKSWELIPPDANSVLIWPLSIDTGAGWAIFSRQQSTWPEQEESMRLLQGMTNSLRIVAEGCLLLEKAIRDGLTSLHNVSYFKSVLEREIRRAARHHSICSVCIFDVDHFKKVNDTYGHQTGDQALAHVAKIILESVRRSDLVARYGGEEFVLLLPDTDALGAKTLAEKIRKRIADSPFMTSKGELSVKVSAGCAEFPGMAKDSAALMELADQGLYLAKNSGRNRVCVVDTGRSPIVAKG